MSLTRKQQNAISAAPQARRAAMRQSFIQQNAQVAQPSRVQRPVQIASRQSRRRTAMAVPRVLPQAAKAIAGRVPRGLGLSKAALAKLWDPLNPRPIGTAVSDGHAHSITGMTRHSIELTGTSKAMILVTNTGSTGMVGVVFQWNANVITASSLVIPTLADDASAGNGPTAARAMKCSLTLLNSTSARKISGSVVFLNATQRIVWPTVAGSSAAAITIAQAEEIFDQIRNQQQAQLCTGDQFKHPKCAFAHPANEPEYTKFSPFVGTTAGDLVDTQSTFASDQAKLHDMGWLLHKVSTSSATSPLTRVWESDNGPLRPMSTLCILLDTPAELQTYTLTARASYYTRWPMSHVLGQHHPAIPAVGTDLVNAARDAAEEVGSVVKDVTQQVTRPEAAVEGALHAADRLA